MTRALATATLRRMQAALAKTVTVDGIIFQSEDRRFTVVEGIAEDDEAPIVLVGDLGEVAVGETLAVRGRFQEHKLYGRRFQVDSFSPITPNSLAGMKRYLGSGLVPGVGPALADKIVERFGERTLDVITTQSDRLRQVGGIGKKRARKIAQAVRGRREEAEAMSYLQSLGLGPGLAKRVRHKYGADTVRVLRSDPYLVAEEVKGIGFLTADKIGRALGYEVDDPRRAAGAVLHLVGKAADEGHVFVDAQALVEQARALDVPDARSRAAVDDLSQRGMLVTDGEAVYAPPLYRAERHAARRLRELSVPLPPPPLAHGSLRSAIEAAAEDRLVEAQRQAVEASLQHGLLVLTGGPGTGKTTTVRAIVNVHRKVERKVLLCAPTGRAAKRLSETSGETAVTIHRLLEYNPKLGRFMRDRHHPLEADLVLVDEASMLDLQLAHRLLAAVPDHCALLLVGDVDQLPPVGAGPVLREVLQSEVCPVVRLSQVFRQAQLSAIVRGAHDILNDRRPTPTPLGTRGDGDLFLVRSRDPGVLRDRLLASLDRMRAVYGLDPRRDVQVLSPMRRGVLGVDQLNTLLQEALNPGSTRGVLGLRRGDKVMQLKNDYEREVFNGDLGFVVEVTRSEATVDFAGRAVGYQGDALEALVLAYASTVHKVQGSEFPAVVLLLHGTHHILLSRPLLYTALTRAKRLAVILTEDRALGAAIRNTAMQQTNCRLAARMREAPPTH